VVVRQEFEDALDVIQARGSVVVCQTISPEGVSSNSRCESLPC
jgi:hypothetical protein